MILDYTKESAIANLFSVVDAATDQVMDRDRPYFYADDEAGVVRRYDQGSGGRFLTRNRDTESPTLAWTEYAMPIRIVPRADLADDLRETAVRILAERG